MTSTYTYFTAFFVAIFFSIHLPAQCFSIETILADACGDPEGANEMVIINTFSDIEVNQLSFDWPNNPFLSWCADANLTNLLNQTIQSSCGFLLEPPQGVVPANEKLIVVSSTDMLINANSFEGLDDTLYIIYQCAGNTSGHFSNLASSPRSLRVDYNGGCNQSQTRTYLPTNLTGGDGGAVFYDSSGNASYFNTGCNAPVTQLKPYWTFPSVICSDYGVIDLNDFLTSSATTDGTWTGDISNSNFFDPANKLGSYTITYTVEDINSCIGAKDSTLTFTVKNQAFGRDTIIRCDSIRQFGTLITEDTIIDITVSGSNPFSCDSTVSRFYKIERLDFEVSPSEITLNSGESFSFTILGNSSNNYEIWSTMNMDTCLSPCVQTSLTPTDEGTYFIQLSDNSNCSSIRTITVRLNFFSSLDIPTAFTPNGDGQNDQFKLYGKDLTSVNFKIYSRWGELLFEGNNLNEQWDGRFKNKALESGSYLLQVEAAGKDGQRYELTQTLNLLR